MARRGATDAVFAVFYVKTDYDLAVVGGGINGCGIARDAAGRGLSVLLVEQGDLAGGTSSASTKLIHGGLRYLEHFAFRLVRESLAERETLMRIAPHVVRPMRFVLPHAAGMRPAWLVRCGLFLYDRMAGGRRAALPPCRRIHPARGGERDAPGLPEAKGGFEYSDCWADDFRLVALNAMCAARRGARIMTRTRCAKIQAREGGWSLTLEKRANDEKGDGDFPPVYGGEKWEASAKFIVNAAGPWAGRFFDAADEPEPENFRLVQGSHIVLPRFFEGERAYILQNPDRRMIFAIPYCDDFVLVGTTEQDFQGDPAGARASGEEVRYLLDAVQRFFGFSFGPGDVKRSFCGVRALRAPMSGEARKASRDYDLELRCVSQKSFMISALGGKLTTYRRLAEAVLNKLRRHAGLQISPDSWTGSKPLPGGDLPSGGAQDMAARLRAAHPDMGGAHALRIARAYGSCARAFLPGGEDCDARPGEPPLGEDFGAGLRAAEVDYLMREEWARTAEDVLWRRSQIGMFFDAGQTARLRAYMSSRRLAQAAAT